jgi:hypothetical protein
MLLLLLHLTGCLTLVRRSRAAKILVVLSLFASFSVVRLFASSPALSAYTSSTDGRSPDVSDPDYDDNVNRRLIRPSIIDRRLLSPPDCAGLLAGDPVQIGLTRAMLFREPSPLLIGRRRLDDDDNVVATANCSRYRRRLRRQSVTESPSSGLFPVAYVIVADQPNCSAEQTELLLRAVQGGDYDVYCLAMEASTSAEFRSSMHRRLKHRSKSNVTSADDDAEEDGKEAEEREEDCRSGVAVWRCVDKLLAYRDDWTYVISISAFALPLRSGRQVAGFLKAASSALQSRRKDRPQQPTRHDSLPFSFRDLVTGYAYSRAAVNRMSVERHLTTVRRRTTTAAAVASAATTTRPHSPGSSTALQRPTDAAAVIDVSVRKACRQERRCFYGVADLSSIIRQPKIFAQDFDINFDYLAVQCLLQSVNVTIS